jgi:hypothetical protein
MHSFLPVFIQAYCLSPRIKGIVLNLNDNLLSRKTTNTNSSRSHGIDRRTAMIYVPGQNLGEAALLLFHPEGK